MLIHIPLDGRELPVEALPAQIFTSGTNAGYIEVTFRAGDPLPVQQLYHGLRLHVPGELDLLRPTAHDANGAGAVFTFFSAEVSNSGRLPHTLGLVWQDGGPRPVAPLAFEEAGPERLQELDGEPDLASHTQSDVESL
jgi:hypothetical protein